jgi:hypothetical protein
MVIRIQNNKIRFFKTMFSNMLNKYLGKSKIIFDITKKHNYICSYSCNMGKSLEEVNESVSTLDKKSAFRKILAFWSIYLISVGWIPETGRLILQEEPVWYSLLWVLLMSNIMALLLQSLSARLGIVTQRDLAQASRETIRHLSITFFIF